MAGRHLFITIGCLGSGHGYLMLSIHRFPGAQRVDNFIYNLFYKIFSYLFYIFIDIRWHSCIWSVENARRFSPREWNPIR